ncbi:MAG: hypothetical protein R3F37_10225 [Candidatus Competibacteraceae bacterium]
MIYVLSSASRDRSARLWDAETGIELRRFEGHEAPVNSAVLSNDSRFVLTASDDHSARLWDAETGIELRRFEGHEAPVNSAVLSNDSRFVLTASGNHLLYTNKGHSIPTMIGAHGYGIPKQGLNCAASKAMSQQSTQQS